MPKYRARPVTITAVQLSWRTWNEVCELLGDALLAENPAGAHETTEHAASDTCGEDGPTYITLNVRTVQGNVVPVRHGDFIIPDREPGTFYPCAPAVFAERWEPVTQPEAVITVHPDPPHVADAVRDIRQHGAPSRRS